MATAAHTELCTICKRQNTTSTADRWCPECDDFLCTSCCNHHKFAKFSKDHSTVDVATGKDLQKIILDIKTKCRIHDHQLEFFCTKCDSSFCIRCTPDHKQCGSFSTLRGFEGSEKSAVFEELIESISNLKSILVEFKDIKQDNLSSFEHQYLNCKRQIQDVRVKINNKIETIEAAMLQELELLYKKSKSNIENIVRQCNESERKLDKLQTDFTTMESICSNIQNFHSVQKFKTDISELKNEIQEITKRDDNKKVELKLNLDPKCLDGTVIHSFGEIKLDEHAFGDFFHWFKGKNSQILDIENITLKRNLDVDLSDIVGDSFILGCCYGDDETILIIASRDNARIIVLREDGTYDREIKMQDELNKIVFAKGKIYVSSYSKQSLTSVDFSTGQIIKKVKFDNICDALALANECLIINVVKKEYRIYNLDLEYIGTIPIKSGTTAHHVSYLNMKIYFAESSPEICVSCYDIRGTLQWKCQDENLPLISGCTVDGRGNVFGAGFLENNIVIISSNGKKWKIATQLANMKRSTAVYCDRHRERLLVISDISPRLQEYEIQY